MRFPAARMRTLAGAALVAIQACGAPQHSQTQQAAAPDPSKQGLAFYLLADTSLSVEEVRKSRLADLKLAQRPLFTESDLVQYAWGAHAFTVTPQALERAQAALARLSTRTAQPFVVTVGGQAVYVGVFWPIWSSMLPKGMPHIMAPLLRDELQVQGPLPGTPDPRSDARIRTALAAAGVLRD